MTPDRSGNTGFLRRCIMVAAVTLGTLMIVWFVWATAHALLLLFSAFLVAVGFDGLGRIVHKFTRLSQRKSVVLVVVALVVAFSLVFTVGTLNVVAQAPQLRKQVEQSVDKIESRLKHSHLTGGLTGGSSGAGAKASSKSNSLGETLTGELSGELAGAASLTLTTFGDIFIVLIIGLYFALLPALHQRVLLQLFPPSRQRHVAHITGEAANAIRRWLAGRIVCMIVVGVGSAVGLWLLGIPFALLLGLIAGLLTFIPYLGAIISAVPPVLVAFLHGYHAALYVAGLYLGLHIIEGYLLGPFIQRRAVSIAPGFLLSAQVLGAAVAGVLGVALAAPLALVIAVMIQIGYIHDMMGRTPHLPGGTDDAD